MSISISEGFFQQLLKQTDAMGAVAKLSQFWTNRLDKGSPQFGLTQPEYISQLVLIYAGEVGNGGHAQYFENRGVDFASDTIWALKQTSLQRLAEIHESALGTVEGAMLTELSPNARIVLEDLDRKAWQLLPEVDAALLRHLREEEALVLMPERAKA